MEKFQLPKFGQILTGIASGLGVCQIDAAILVAAVLGNISGRAAGLHGIQGRAATAGNSHSPGINLLFAGENLYRFRRVVQRVIGPALAMQEWLREEALFQHRRALDQFKYGPENSLHPEGPRDIFYERTLAMKDEIEKEMGNPECLPRNWASEASISDGPDSFSRAFIHPIKSRLPNVRHRPSFVFVGSNAVRLDRMLGETFDHRVFLVDLSGDFFKGSFTKGATKGNRAIADLVDCLGATDFEPPQLNSNQGYGSLQSSRATVFAAVSLAEIGAIMDGDDPVGSQILNQSVLWTPQWSSLNYDNVVAWSYFEKSIHEVLRERIARRGPAIVLSPEAQCMLAALENEVDDAIPKQYQRELAAFGSLTHHVLWAFLVLQRAEKNDWAFSVTRATVIHALRNQVSVLDQAANHAETQRTKEISRKILAALARKGSLTARSLQRSISECKQADLILALERLIKESRVRFAASNRVYEIVQHARRTP